MDHVDACPCSTIIGIALFCFSVIPCSLCTSFHCRRRSIAMPPKRKAAPKAKTADDASVANFTARRPVINGKLRPLR